MLNVQIQTRDSSVQLICTGRLVRGEECEVLKRTVLDRLEATVTLHLSGLRLVDAAGLGTLAYLHHRFLAQGRKLVLAAPPEFLLRLFRLTGLHKVLTVKRVLEHAA